MPRRIIQQFRVGIIITGIVFAVAGILVISTTHSVFWGTFCLVPALILTLLAPMYNEY